MAGTRRGAQGSGRVTRAEARPIERRERLQDRLDHSKNGRQKVSWISAHLRSIMADPDVDQADVDQIANQTVIYLLALSDQLESTITRKEKK